jgi:hypothetical protein
VNIEYGGDMVLSNVGNHPEGHNRFLTLLVGSLVGDMVSYSLSLTIRQLLRRVVFFLNNWLITSPVIYGREGLCHAVRNGTHVNFETARSRKQLHIALQCSGGFQKLVPVVDETSEKPCAFYGQFMFY